MQETGKEKRKFFTQYKYNCKCGNETIIFTDYKQLKKIKCWKCKSEIKIKMGS